MKTNKSNTKSKSYLSIFMLTLFTFLTLFAVNGVNQAWAEGKGYGKDKKGEQRDWKGYDDDDDDGGSRGSRNFKHRREFRDRGPGGPFMGMLGFDNLDENQDGEISKEEALAMAKKIFSDYDNDKNGEISQEEFTSFNVDRGKKFAELGYRQLNDEMTSRLGERSDKIFTRLDVNENGQVSEEEFYQKRIDNIFSRFDRDEDGMIDQKEMRRKK